METVNESGARERRIGLDRGFPKPIDADRRWTPELL